LGVQANNHKSLTAATVDAIFSGGVEFNVTCQQLAMPAEKIFRNLCAYAGRISFLGKYGEKGLFDG